MTFFFEVGLPWNWMPGYFRSRVMRRVWWGPFAVAQLLISLDDYADRSRYEWIEPKGRN